MKIYDRQGTPNAARVRIVVAAKGLEEQVDYVKVDLVAAEQKQDWFLKLNPIGKTPVLVCEDGLVLSESPAITEYLDNLDGDPILTGRTAREKGLICMMQRRVEIMLLDPVDDYFHYGTKGLGEALRPWRMPDWPAKKDWGERRGRLAVENLPYFDGVLRERPFLAGEAFSLADISLFAGYAFAKGAGLPIAAELTALHDWWARVGEVPAVKNRSGQGF
ncbi:MAG: glutathione S-transferase [Sphingomonadales bacterium]|nr:glutathione S-transferase [Sphingomonadales bacterium]